MAKIRKENGRIFADGQPVEMGKFRKLTDDEFNAVDGGIKIYTKSH